MSEAWLYRLRDISAGLVVGGIIMATVAEGVEGSAAISAATNSYAGDQLARAEYTQLAGDAAAVIGSLGAFAAWVALAGAPPLSKAEQKL